jgi:ParB/RepB/Spo0J family partition protein
MSLDVRAAPVSSVSEEEVPSSVGAPLSGPEVRLIPLSLIDESPSNPRRTFGDIFDLAQNIQVHGVLQPVQVRPRGSRYELVFGHRRCRAAKEAGLLEVPALVRELSDEAVLEMQVVENGQREDVHPLEEAEGYERLLKAKGGSAAAVATVTGKSLAYVYGRLKLCALCPEARKMFLAGKVDASTALLVARIPSKELQLQALKEVTRVQWNDSPMSFREAKEHLHRHYTAAGGGPPAVRREPAGGGAARVGGGGDVAAAQPLCAPGRLWGVLHPWVRDVRPGCLCPRGRGKCAGGLRVRAGGRRGPGRERGGWRVGRGTPRVAA